MCKYIYLHTYIDPWADRASILGGDCVAAPGELDFDRDIAERDSSLCQLQDSRRGHAPVRRRGHV